MAINNSLENRFEGDDFVLVINIQDTGSLDGFKAEFKVYEKHPDTGNITEKLIKTTAGDFNPDSGGIEFDQNKVLITFDTGDFDGGSLEHGKQYLGRLLLWDGDDKQVVSATGPMMWNDHPDKETFA